MPFSTDSVTEIFSNATVSNGALTIPSGAITSYIPLSTSSPAVYEMVFGLLDTMASAVATGNLSNISVNQTQSLAGDTLVKRYNFTVNLNYNGDAVDGLLNVKPEVVL